jgi:hypothetical protein
VALLLCVKSVNRIANRSIALAVFIMICWMAGMVAIPGHLRLPGHLPDYPL